MSSKQLVIVEARSEVDRLVPAAEEGRMPVIVTLNDNLSDELRQRGLLVKTLEDYGLSEERLEEEGLKWFRSFPGVKTRDNRSIKEQLTYEGVSVWWLVDELLYLSPYVFHELRQVIRHVIAFEHIIRAEAPSAVYYISNNTAISQALDLVTTAMKMPAVKLPGSSGLKQALSDKRRWLIYVYGPCLQMLVRKAFWTILARVIPSRGDSHRERLLMFMGDQWVDTRDPRTGELMKGNLYYDSVINLLKDDYDAVSVGIPTAGWSLGIMRRQRRNHRVIYRPFEHYLNIKIIFKGLKAADRLHREYKALEGCDSFRQSLNYRDLPVYEVAKKKLSLFFSRGYLARVISTIEMAGRMLDSERPRAVLQCEGAGAERAIIAVARARGIPVIAIVHGYAMMSHALRLYHAPEDIGPGKEATAPYCPLPDKLIVYGQHDREIVVRQARLPEEDVIVGVPRYDILASMGRFIGRDDILSRLGLDPAKKLVTWMTQSHSYSLAENRKNMVAVFNALRGLNGVQLVVKPHPAEGKRWALMYLEDRSFRPLIVSGIGSITYELLFASDLVITHYCTTMIEALMLDKPVIIIDFSGRPNRVACVDSGAAIAVHVEEALGPVVNDLLHGEKARQEMAAACERFLTEGRYRPDGRASQRVADLIREMIAQSGLQGERVASMGLSNFKI